MNFGFTEEQELLRKTARDFLAEHAPMNRVRQVMEGDRGPVGEIWQQMAELGWTGLDLPEAHGGAGLTLVDLCVVLEELGRGLTPVPFLSTMIAAAALAELGDEAQQAAWLPEVAAGRARGSLALTEESGSDDFDALELAAKRGGSGWVLSGRKLFVPDGTEADFFVVVARIDGKGVGAFRVARETAGVEVQAMQGMDRLRPLAQVDFADAQLPADALLGGDEDAAPKLRRVLDRACVMLCAEMVGGAEKCLEDSVAYAKERVQFGKPIGVNQAIKHKCADMLFQVESARSITYYAAWALQEGHEEAALSAAMAKSYASDAYRHVAAENIQIHGGVGFTWEYDCHLYFKRAKSAETWLGDATLHRERVAGLMGI